MGVEGGGFGGVAMRGVMAWMEVGRGLGVCWLVGGVGMGVTRVLWAKARLWVFREVGWGGRLMLTLVLMVKEEEGMLGSGGLGLGGK